MYIIPEGAKPGMTFQVPHPDGDPNKPIRYQLMTNKDRVTIEYFHCLLL